MDSVVFRVAKEMSQECGRVPAPREEEKEAAGDVDVGCCGPAADQAETRIAALTMLGICMDIGEG